MVSVQKLQYRITVGADMIRPYLLEITDEYSMIQLEDVRDTGG